MTTKRNWFQMMTEWETYPPGVTPYGVKFPPFGHSDIPPRALKPKISPLRGGSVAEKKSRSLAPCGTTAAAKRHRRRGEPPCPECRAAERAASKAARDRKAAERPPEPVVGAPAPAPVVQTVGQSDVVVIEQVGAYGSVREVPVPTHEDPLESARWRLTGLVPRSLSPHHAILPG